MIGPDSSPRADARADDAERCPCGGTMVRVPYVGGDHDPSHECDRCGRHDGCWSCERDRREVSR